MLKARHAAALSEEVPTIEIGLGPGPWVDPQSRKIRGRSDLILGAGKRMVKMRIPPGMSATVTHNMIIADRSEAGMFAVATVLDICPEVNDRVSAWRDSTDRFFLFLVEQKSCRIGSLTARDLKQLLAEALPKLYLDLLKPPANVAFDIFVEEPDDGAIEDRIAQLLIGVALEAVLSP